MRRLLSPVMIVGGIGLAVYAFSDYTPVATGEFAGWLDSCRYVMTLGAMLAAGGKLLS